MDNKILYQNALKAIERMYSDLSVPPEKAKENLKGLRDEIDIYLDMIESDPK